MSTKQQALILPGHLGQQAPILNNELSLSRATCKHEGLGRVPPFTLCFNVAAARLQV
jgi:hypothetical protein